MLYNTGSYIEHRIIEGILYTFKKKKKKEVGVATKRRLEWSTLHFVPRVIIVVEILIIPWKGKQQQHKCLQATRMTVHI